MKNYEIAKWLKMILVFLGSIAVLICVYVIPSFSKQMAIGDLENYKLIRLIVLFIYITMIPFIYAIFQGVKLCKELLSTSGFSENIAKIFLVISRCAFVEAMLYGGLSVVFLVFGLKNPMFLVITIMIILTASAIAIFTAILSKFAYNAVDLQKENELTI